MRRILIGVAAVVGIAAVAAALYFSVMRGEFVGSRLSNKYHDVSCTWAQTMSSDSRVWFADAAEAEAAGYEACGSCDPGQPE